MGKHQKTKKQKPKHGRKPKSWNELRRAAKRRLKVEEGVRTIKIRRGERLVEVSKPVGHNQLFFSPRLLNVAQKLP